MTTPNNARRRKAVPEPIRRELRALRYIAKHLENVSPAGRRWLRDWLTDNLARHP